MVTNSRCPKCGTVEDSRMSTYGHIQCPGCLERYWIPVEVFRSAPYAERTVDDIEIIGSYFDDISGYRVLTRNRFGQFVVGRGYDPFRGFWLGGDYFDDIASARENVRDSKQIGGA